MVLYKAINFTSVASHDYKIWQTCKHNIGHIYYKVWCFHQYPTSGLWPIAYYFCLLLDNHKHAWPWDSTEVKIVKLTPQPIGHCSVHSFDSQRDNVPINHKPLKFSYLNTVSGYRLITFFLAGSLLKFLMNFCKIEIYFLQIYSCGLPNEKRRISTFSNRP